MTKADEIELARHDERISHLESFEQDTQATLKSMVDLLGRQELKLIKYRNSNAMWALTLTAIQGIITTLALIFTGQSTEVLSYIDKHF